MGVLVQGGTGARRTTSSKHLFPFESKALQSSVYARFVPTAAFSLLCLLSASALVFRLPFARQSVPNIRKDRRQECGGASYLSVDGVLEASAGCIAVLEELSSCSKYAAIVVVVVVVARRAGNFCKGGMHPTVSAFRSYCCTGQDASGLQPETSVLRSLESFTYKAGIWILNALVMKELLLASPHLSVFLP
ncbi:unnamed protein product [Sphagnum jensenii]